MPDVFTKNCPSCGAQADFDRGRDESVCSFCNSKIYTGQAQGREAAGADPEQNPRVKSRTLMKSGFIIALIFTVIFAGRMVFIMFNLPDEIKITVTDDFTYHEILPKSNEIIIILQEAPLTVEFIHEESGTVGARTKINAVEWEQISIDEDSANIKIIFKCRKIYDWEGENGRTGVAVLLTLRNCDGDIMFSDKFGMENLLTEQIFDLTYSAAFSPGKRYTVELADYYA
jgi:hypothetical protein